MTINLWIVASSYTAARNGKTRERKRTNFEIVFTVTNTVLSPERLVKQITRENASVPVNSMARRGLADCQEFIAETSNAANLSSRAILLSLTTNCSVCANTSIPYELRDKRNNKTHPVSYYAFLDALAERFPRTPRRVSSRIPNYSNG